MDCNRPRPHQPLTWLNFCPQSFELVTFTLHSDLTIHPITVYYMHHGIKYKIIITGEVRAGGVILHPDEEVKMQFAWGLGNWTDNQANFLALWQGLEIAIARWIQHLVVYGDSMIFIQKIHKIKGKQKNHLSDGI